MCTCVHGMFVCLVWNSSNINSNISSNINVIAPDKIAVPTRNYAVNRFYGRTLSSPLIIAKP